MNHTKNLLDILFNTFESKNINYCILHGYETLPESTTSDVDIVLDDKGRKELDTIVTKVSFETDFTITQKIYYDIPHCYFYVLVHIENGSTEIIQLDIIIDGLEINRYFFSSETLLKDRQKYKNFYIPAVSTEFMYVFYKKIVKRNFQEEHRQYLLNLYNSNQGLVEVNISKYFGEENLSEIRQMLLQDTKILSTTLKKMETLFVKKNHTILRRIKRFFWLSYRGIYRIFNPTGMVVVILSPDGGGKTSVAKGLLNRLHRSFRRTQYIYWRPSILPEIGDLLHLRFRPQQGRTNPDPHGKKDQRRIKSFLRFLYYTLDYTLGFVKFRYLKTISTLVVLDRYYYDFIVDRKRYGFNLPVWMPKLLSKIIPKPDLVLYLDNEPAAIYKRKQELTMEELRRQVHIFRGLTPLLPNAHIINTDKNLEIVVAECTRQVVKRKAIMLESHLNLEEIK